jgi:hypothetical protein
MAMAVPTAIVTAIVKIGDAARFVADFRNIDLTPKIRSQDLQKFSSSRPLNRSKRGIPSPNARIISDP